MPVRFTVDTEGAKEAYDYLHGIGEKVGPMLKDLGVDTLREVQAEALRNLSGTYPGPNQEHVLAVRSGTLRRFTSIQPITVESDGLSWGLPAGVKESIIGAKLEAGGTIKATNCRMLRIPLPSALTSKGVDRNAGRSLRGDKDYFFGMSKAGNPILFKRVSVGKGGFQKAVPWYVLRASVNIRGRGWFTAAVTTVESTKMAGLEEKHMTVLLRGKPA